jgi:hypothetical protein
VPLPLIRTLRTALTAKPTRFDLCSPPCPCKHIDRVAYVIGCSAAAVCSMRVLCRVGRPKRESLDGEALTVASLPLETLVRILDMMFVGIRDAASLYQSSQVKSVRLGWRAHLALACRTPRSSMPQRLIGSLLDWKLQQCHWY